MALLTANVNQLRHVLELQDDTMRTVNIVFLALSIVLQVKEYYNFNISRNYKYVPTRGTSIRCAREVRKSRNPKGNSVDP